MIDVYIIQTHVQYVTSLRHLPANQMSVADPHTLSNVDGHVKPS